MPRLLVSLLPLALAVAFAAAPAGAQASASTIGATARTELRVGGTGIRPGVQRLHYEFGPVHIAPGQNTIEFEGNDLKPDVPGWIVGFKPD